MTKQIFRRLIPRRSSVQRTPARRSAMMDTLESRTLFSTASTVVHVGPSEAIKSLDAVKWPAVGSTASLTVLVDYSATPYSVGHHGFGGNVTIEPSGTRPSRRLWKLQPTNYPTFYSNYKLLIKNIKTVGGSKIILTGTNTKGSVDVEDVNMMDGGRQFKRGQGKCGQCRIFQRQQCLRHGLRLRLQQLHRPRSERHHRQQRHESPRCRKACDRQRFVSWIRTT